MLEIMTFIPRLHGTLILYHATGINHFKRGAGIWKFWSSHVYKAEPSACGCTGSKMHRDGRRGWSSSPSPCSWCGPSYWGPYGLTPSASSSLPRTMCPQCDLQSVHQGRRQNCDRVYWLQGRWSGRRTTRTLPPWRMPRWQGAWKQRLVEWPYSWGKKELMYVMRL